jgi:hypothetical protein
MNDADKKKWYRRIVLAGVVLGVVCHFLPAEYQTPCRTLANLCTGGL